MELSRKCEKPFVPNRLEKRGYRKAAVGQKQVPAVQSGGQMDALAVAPRGNPLPALPGPGESLQALKVLARIYQTSKIKGVAFTKLAQWYNEVEQAGFKSFSTVSRTTQNHYSTILNFFDNRSTNASAESFNTKIKAFRAQFRGVTNIEFFLFRLSNIYA